MNPFVYSGLPVRVVFGRGTLAQVPAELDRLGAKRALVLTTAQQAQEGHKLGQSLGAAFVGAFAGAVMHTPVDVTAQALEKPYWNPRPIERAGIRDLIARAFAGEAPAGGAPA